jgi:hypothetical protein
MTPNDAFAISAVLINEGFAASHREVGRDWFGHSRNYMSDLRRGASNSMTGSTVADLKRRLDWCAAMAPRAMDGVRKVRAVITQTEDRAAFLRR